MADAPNQQQQQQVNPQEARAFLATFGHAADKLPDDQVTPLYTTVKTSAEGFITKGVETALKERGPFGADWRQHIAGENPDDLKTLERFHDPAALWNRTKELNRKLSSGELKSTAPYPDKGTADQQAQWRAEQGIPDKPEGYEVKPPAGVVIGEADKPFVDGFLKHAHANHMKPADVNSAITWWAEERVRRQEAAALQQADLKKQTEDALRSAWGNEYRPNMTRIEQLLDAKISANSDLKAAVLNSINMNPEFANLFAAIAVELNPNSTLVPGDGAAQIGSIEDGIRKIEKAMRTDRKGYDRDPKMQEDYRKYLAAYQRLSGKEWGAKA